MKTFIAFILSISLAFPAFAQHELKGGIDVWNNSGSTVSLADDFFYHLAPGDELKVTITGTANIAPRDERRKGGGFLGLFKKSYNVRIDDWKAAGQVDIAVQVGNFGLITLTPDAGNQFLTGTYTIPQNAGSLQAELLTTSKIIAWVRTPMSPLRAGRYEMKLEVDSKPRLVMLETFLSTRQMQDLPILNFENDIRPLVENGKLIYKHPDATVKVVGEKLAGKPNIGAIKKDLYKYLLQFAPNNTSVRAELAQVYLEELNFSEAQAEAKQTIINLSKKTAGTLTPQDQTSYGRAYEVLAGVNELRELGLQENAYSVGAVFYGQSAEWYDKAKSKDDYTRSVMNQVRCLQKVGTLEALKQSADILLDFDTKITR